MADRLTQSENDSFYDITTGFDEYDHGLASFNEVVRRSTMYLNDHGGRDSMSYRGTLIELNDNWEYLDQTATVSGRVYLLDENAITLAPEDWSGPFEDERGVYFVVEDAELISLGVVDAFIEKSDQESEGEGVANPVLLVHAFAPGDIETDEPIFCSTPDDILSWRYDLPTREATAYRLHYHWPKQMKKLDRWIDKAGVDPAQKIRYLEKAITILQESLQDSEDLRLWLPRYIYECLDFDVRWPYGVVISGDAFVTEPDSEPVSVAFTNSATQYLKISGLSIYFDEHDKERGAEVCIVFESPTSQVDAEDVDTYLTVPLRSIANMFATRPMGSISEILESGKEANESDRTADALRPDDVEISDTSVAEAGERIHPRIAEMRRLEKLQNLITQMTNEANQLRSVRFKDREAAMEASQGLIRCYFEQMQGLDLEDSDLIRVTGEGVVKANATLKSGLGVLKVSQDTEMPIISPTVATDVMGCYEAFLAEVDEYTDEKDGAAYWQVAPKMILRTRDTRVNMTGNTFNYPLLSVAVKSSVAARLDSSVSFSVPEYERIKARNGALLRLGTTHRGDVNATRMKAIGEAFMHENPADFTEARAAVRHIKRVAQSLYEEYDEEVMAGLRHQLTQRKVQLLADAWIGTRHTQQANLTGTIVDVYETEIAGGKEIVAALANDTNILDDNHRNAEPAQLIALRTLKELRF